MIIFSSVLFLFYFQTIVQWRRKGYFNIANDIGV